MARPGEHADGPPPFGRRRRRAAGELGPCCPVARSARWRRLLLSLTTFASLAAASCRTLARVRRGPDPVEGAEVYLVYSSLTIGPSVTDERGYVWLADSWWQRPLFIMRPQWIAIGLPDGRSVSFAYPHCGVLQVEERQPH